jgi:hypothetical protein
MEPEDSLQCTQEPTAGLYSEGRFIQSTPATLLP